MVWALSSAVNGEWMSRDSQKLRSGGCCSPGVRGWPSGTGLCGMAKDFPARRIRTVVQLGWTPAQGVCLCEEIPPHSVVQQVLGGAATARAAASLLGQGDAPHCLGLVRICCSA